MSKNPMTNLTVPVPDDMRDSLEAHQQRLQRLEPDERISLGYVVRSLLRVGLDSLDD